MDSTSPAMGSARPPDRLAGMRIARLPRIGYEPALVALWAAQVFGSGSRMARCWGLSGVVDLDPVGAASLALHRAPAPVACSLLAPRSRDLELLVAEVSDELQCPAERGHEAMDGLGSQPPSSTTFKITKYAGIMAI